jgi:hypothetical protein
MFTDGQRFVRNDDDECEVQNNVDACTNSLLHDQLRLGCHAEIGKKNPIRFQIHFQLDF